MGWVLKWSDIKHRLLMLIGISVVIMGFLFIFDLLPFRQELSRTWNGVIVDQETKEVIAEATLRMDGEMDWNFLLKENYSGAVTIEIPATGERMSAEDVSLVHQRSGDGWVLGGGYIEQFAPSAMLLNTDKTMERMWLSLGGEAFDGIEFVSHAKTIDEVTTVKALLLQGE